MDIKPTKLVRTLTDDIKDPLKDLNTSDPLFTTTPIFTMKNYEANMISTVSISRTSIAIGTQSGRVMVFN